MFDETPMRVEAEQITPEQSDFIIDEVQLLSCFEQLCLSNFEQLEPAPAHRRSEPTKVATANIAIHLVGSTKRNRDNVALSALSALWRWLQTIYITLVCQAHNRLITTSGELGYRVGRI